MVVRSCSYQEQAIRKLWKGGKRPLSFLPAAWGSVVVRLN